MVAILSSLLKMEMEMEMTTNPLLILTLSSQDLVEIISDHMALKETNDPNGVELIITDYYLLYLY